VNSHQSIEVEIGAEVNLLRITHGLIVAARRVPSTFGGEVREQVDARILQPRSRAAPVTRHGVLAKPPLVASCLLGHCGIRKQRGSGDQD
jgi:hypothetical protein